MRWLTLMAAVFLAACGNGTTTDGGTDGGKDAGTDGGDDGGLDGGNDGGVICNGGLFVDGSGDGYRAPPAGIDGVTGVPSQVWRLAQEDLVTTRPVPRACIHATTTGPGGQAIATTLGGDPQRQPSYVYAEFTPPSAGTYHVTLSIFQGATFSYDVDVFDPEPADVTLPRGCGSLVFASGHLGCDEALFRPDGSVAASLDGGRWLSAGDALLAWQGGALSYATLDDGGVSFGPSTASAEPRSWSSYGAQLAVGSLDAGMLYALDGGSLSPTGSLPPGWVDVLSNGSVLTLDVNRWDSPFGLLYAANADQLVAWVGLNTINGGGVGCFAPDAGTASQSTCGAMFTPVYFQLADDAWRLPRRPLAATSQGVRLPGTGAMYLPNATQITDGDDFAWQSSANQTAIWFR